MRSPTTPSHKQLREFGLLIGVVFPIILGWLLPALHGASFRTWTLWISLPGLALGIFQPRLLALPYKGWIALGYALGWINSHIILGLVYILVLQPIAILMRFTGHDPLRSKRHNLASYREQRGSTTTNFNRIF